VRHARPGFLGSVGHAYDGLMHALSQRNMKIHMVSAILVGLVGSGAPFGVPERVTLLFCVLLVFFAEILNTALEALVDLYTAEYRPLAKVAKDTAAAGVLVLSSGTVVIFAALLVQDWERITSDVDRIWQQVFLGVPFAGICAAMLVRRWRPRVVDHFLFATAMLLWWRLWDHTTSVVFTTLLGVLSLLCWRASSRIHARLQPEPARTEAA